MAKKQALAASKCAARSPHVPQVKVVVDAPVQMERELTLLRQKAGSVSPATWNPDGRCWRCPADGPRAQCGRICAR